MVPFILTISVFSNFEIIKSGTEIGTSTLFERGKNTAPAEFFYQINNEQMKPFTKNIGTKFIDSSIIKTTSFNEKELNLFEEDYDLVSKQFSSKKIVRKVHIRSVSKFTPRIVF